MSNRIRTAGDVEYRKTGMGIEPLWRCMGCNKDRPSLGSRGTGVRRRCGQCIAAKEAKK